VTNDDDLAARVSALEELVLGFRAEVAVSQKDSRVARVLANAADRDMSEWRLANRSYARALDATRATQLEHGQRLTTLCTDIRGVRADVAGLRADMDELRRQVDGGLTSMTVRLAQVAALLGHRVRED
jgi:hypothetical protein